MIKIVWYLLVCKCIIVIYYCCFDMFLVKFLVLGIFYNNIGRLIMLRV